jgi:Ni/Co efflux regulator RcnB
LASATKQFTPRFLMEGSWRISRNRRNVPMRVLIAALALSLLAIPLAPAQIQLRELSAAKEQSKAPSSETSGGTPRNPDPHIYKVGEHLSEAYGSYELIDDWRTSKLEQPPDGHHWVKYGDNYLLITATDGLIKRIIQAS